MKNRWMARRSFLVLVSFLMTMLLFFYASESNPNRRSSNLSLQTTSNTISNVPIYVDMDSDRYVVTGLPDSVTLRVEGSSSALLAVAGNSSYRVKTPNLNELGPGTHTISLEVTGLPMGVTGVVSPETIEITLENKLTLSFPVTVMVDRNHLPSAYQDGQAVVNPGQVSVTGPDSLMNQIENVVATVTVPENTRADYTTTVVVQAVDATGKPLNVKISPERVQVRVPITISSKQVPVVLSSTGSAGKQYSYQLQSDSSHVTILGSKEVLEKISALPVVVDVSQITKTTKQTLALTLPAGVDSVAPEGITVTIIVTNTTQETTSVEETTQTTTSQQ